MMKAAAALAIAALFCHSAIAVNRCTIDGKTVYQDPPCPGTLGTVGEEIKSKEEWRRLAEQQEAERSARQRQYDAKMAEAKAQRDKDIKRMADYTVAIGRGIACEAPGTHEAYRRVTAWMNERGLSDEYRNVATATIREATKRQREGITPDTCADVRKAFANYPWP